MESNKDLTEINNYDAAPAIGDGPIVDLISFGTGSSREWGMGRSITTSYSVTHIVESVRDLLKLSSEGFILFLLHDQAPAEQSLRRLTETDSIDIWYDDPFTDSLQWPAMLDFVSPVNYFNMKVGNAVSSLSTISLGCLLARKTTLIRNGFLEVRFSSVEGATKEWVHRLIYQGTLFKYTNLVGQGLGTTSSTIPTEDQYRFIKYRFGQKWLYWTLWRSWWTGLATTKEAIHAFGRIRKETRTSPVSIRDHRRWKDTPARKEPVKVTVLIPTVERYPYLTTVLKQLGEQSILPSEVIVIDQTPKRDRKSDLFAGHGKIGLKYFTLDDAGQCTSRNAGLLESQGDFILFIDDDVEIGPDLIENHLKCIDYFNTPVSCGVCDEVGAGPNPKEYSLIRLSDVFPTNNVMVKREVLERSGLFDLAFNKGQRADGDLGARIYKSGTRMILNPDIRLLHYRAPRGGLRKHKARMVTFASSRQYITHFRLPHSTELYFAKIHCTPRQQKEYNLLTLLGTFSIRGGILRKAFKVTYAFIMLPSFLYKLFKRGKAADRMLKVFPNIPHLIPSKGSGSTL